MEGKQPFESRAPDGVRPAPTGEASPTDGPCQRCGVVNRTGAGFCGGCGALIRPAWTLDRDEVFRRPLLVSALATWDAIGGLGSLALAAVLLLVTPGWSAKPVVVLVLVLVGAVHLAAASDLWRLRPAGRPLGILVAVLGLPAVPLGTAVGIVAIFALARPRMRILFSGKQPEEHAAEELAELHRMQAGEEGSGLMGAIAAALLVLLAFPFLAIVAAIAIPNVSHALERGRQRQTAADLEVIASRLEIARSQRGALPADLAEPGGVERFLAAAGDTAPVAAADGWGRPFVVRLEGQSYTLASFGRDGTEDQPGEGEPAADGFDLDLVVVDGEFVSWPPDMAEPPGRWAETGGSDG